MTDTALAADTGLRHKLYRDLADGVSGTARRVLVGLNWTLVVGDDGAGLSHTPARDTGGCFSLPDPGSYAGRGLASLAAMTASDNVFEVAIAIAAANAHYNRFDLTGSDANGLDVVKGDGADTVMIGRFPGIEKRLPKIKVIEREPGPDDYPEEAAPELLPACRNLIVTASTMHDGSLPKLLALAPQAFTVLVGPGTPLAPVLFEHGIDVLSGTVATDVEGLARVLGEGAAVRAMRPYTRNLTLMKPA